MLLALLILATPRFLPVGIMAEPEHTIDSVSPNGSLIMGRIYESSSLPGSGRGAKPHRYAVCEVVTWSSTGAVVASFDLWRDSGLSVRGAAECFQP
jgi:hypothetical protein